MNQSEINHYIKNVSTCIIVYLLAIVCFDRDYGISLLIVFLYCLLFMLLRKNIK